eukprot:TRINITY_DN44584_c0_g1_i1.p1 TRINITY_DN44584_c0_g1~~TRINITY_DN44584_c0_g1_i1.p1  ORF type:complete len:444 (-),score=37.20 TRINITY_DN44584_c0_g1_i1:280-1611(-)
MIFFFLMIRRPPRSTLSSSSAASDVYKRQVSTQSTGVIWALHGHPVVGASNVQKIPRMEQPRFSEEAPKEDSFMDSIADFFSFGCCDQRVSGDHLDVDEVPSSGPMFACCDRSSNGRDMDVCDDDKLNPISNDLQPLRPKSEEEIQTEHEEGLMKCSLDSQDLYNELEQIDSGLLLHLTNSDSDALFNPQVVQISDGEVAGLESNRQSAEMQAALAGYLGMHEEMMMTDLHDAGFNQLSNAGAAQGGPTWFDGQQEWQRVNEPSKRSRSPTSSAPMVLSEESSKSTSLSENSGSLSRVDQPHNYKRAKAHKGRGIETQYRCGYCGRIKTSTSSCSDGRVRIRCECGGQHQDQKSRMHATWTPVSVNNAGANQTSPVAPVDPSTQRTWCQVPVKPSAPRPHRTVGNPKSVGAPPEIVFVDESDVYKKKSEDITMQPPPTLASPA